MAADAVHSRLEAVTVELIGADGEEVIHHTNDKMKSERQD
jgi:hypothetical protein